MRIDIPLCDSKGQRNLTGEHYILLKEKIFINRACFTAEEAPEDESMPWREVLRDYEERIQRSAVTAVSYALRVSTDECWQIDIAGTSNNVFFVVDTRAKAIEIYELLHEYFFGSVNRDYVSAIEGVKKFLNQNPK